MSQRTLTVWNGRSNPEQVLLLEAGAAVALDAVTRVQLMDNGAVIADSSSAGFGAGEPFDATESGTHAGATVDVLTLRLGALDPALTPGVYRHVALVTFDPDHPAGLVWDAGLTLHVRAAAA